MDGSTTLGPFALNEGGNVFVWLDHVGAHGLQAGSHHFAVTYNGDASFNPAHADPVSIAVRKAGIKYVMNPTPTLDEYPVGTPIILPVLFTGFEGSLHGVELPTGNVRLYDCSARDEFDTCTGFSPLAGAPTMHVTSNGPQGPGQAQTLFTLNLPVGEHQIIVAYSGDANYEAIAADDTSPFAAFFNVVPAPAVGSRVTLQQSASTVNLGQAVSYTINVRRLHNSDPAPTGQVQLLDAQSNPLSDIVDLVNGNATIVLPWNSAGTQFLI